MHLKLKGSPLLCLVGFMGCGKSTAGRLLAERLGWAFVDLDDQIEGAAGMTIEQIFTAQGEPRFRQLEQEALRREHSLALRGRARVVALGGGAFLNPNNRELLEVGGVSMWLDCPVEILWERVAGCSHRPLARDREQFQRLYLERLPVYGLADFTIPAANGSPEQIVEAILALGLL